MFIAVAFPRSLSNMRRAVLFAVAAAVAAGYGLIDHPIAGDGAPQYLDGKDWTASSPTVGTSGLSIPASVPGDLITDISNAMGFDPIFERNWKNASIWDQNVWTYTKKFTASQSMLKAVAGGGASDCFVPLWSACYRIPDV